MSQKIWLIITFFGSSNLLFPTLGLASLAMAWKNQWTAVQQWLLALGVAIAITLCSKIAFLGWGIGVGSLDFTGVSGHTLLATAIYPVLLGWVLAGETERFNSTSLSLGLVIAALVGWSRTVLGAHSLSEVVAGWVLGGGVVYLTCIKLSVRGRLPVVMNYALLLLPLSLHTSQVNYLPAHGMIVKTALYLSGHKEPYNRSELHQHPAPKHH